MMSPEDLANSAKKINKLYDKLTYYDLYGSSMFVYFSVTFIVIMVVMYCKAMTNSQEIKDDWNNRRCDPSVIPFAGYINPPEGTSAADFTSDNFSYCVQNIISDGSEEALQPLNSITASITDLYMSLADAIDAIRGALAKLRQRFADIVEKIMGKVLNVITPIQVMFIAFSDIMQKTQATLATALYTILGIYYTLQASMGAAIEGIVKILIVMVGVIAALWIMPFTMPAAAISTAIFLTISIPVAIITAIVSKSLHISSSAVPGLCFDKNTELKMNDGARINISDVKIGDVLENNCIVTGVMQLSRSKETMYELNGVIVSGSHVVKFANNWIKVHEHPYAKFVDEYCEPILYCLNTITKTIAIKGMTFTDWDELYGKSLVTMLKTVKGDFNKIDGGISHGARIELDDGTFVPIERVGLNMVLKNGPIVIGIVKVASTNRRTNYCLGDSIAFTGSNVNVLKNNQSHDELIKKTKNNSSKEEMSSRTLSHTLFHLITDTGEFNVEGILVYDYNSLVDKYSGTFGRNFQIIE